MINRRQFSLAAGASALAGFPAVHAQSEKIIIGQSAAFSGPAAQLGIHLHAGAKLFFDQLNAQGGIGGRPVEIRKLDDGYEPARCEVFTSILVDVVVW
jgi:branched-chain amino acid transport system substrate-binding protein